MYFTPLAIYGILTNQGFVWNYSWWNYSQIPIWETQFVYTSLCTVKAASRYLPPRNGNMLLEKTLLRQGRRQARRVREAGGTACILKPSPFWHIYISLSIYIHTYIYIIYNNNNIHDNDNDNNSNTNNATTATATANATTTTTNNNNNVT